MTNARLLFGLLALLLLPGIAHPASAQVRTQLPSQQHSSIPSPQSIERHTLPSVNTEALQREDEARADEIGPYRYGTVVKTDLTPRRHGTWESLPGGHWLWRLRIQSRNAVSLSVAFTEFRLPKGAVLYVYGPDRELVRGPYTRDDATGGQHRTPLVRGENLIVEMKVPRNQRSRTNLVIGRVVHGYRSIFPSRDNNDASAKAGACNIDVACDEADPWRDQVRSVGGVGFRREDDALFCTGSLLNNTARDRTPYFLTAEHCIQTPEEAESMVFFWNYQNDTCRSPGSPESGNVTDDDPLDQTSSGAILRARYGNVHENGGISGKSDLILVEIDDNIPPQYNLFFNGWSRADQSTQESVTIHHPQGHGKRISFDDDPTSITAYLESGGGNTHLRIGNWERGTTEGGSSGSPLFDTDQRVVGVLSGGSAGCDFDGDIDDNNEPDWYGRLAPGFSNGDYQNSTLADWLDPNNSGLETLDGIPQKDIDDDTPPAKIDDLRVSAIDTTSMTLTWTATGDDGGTGTALTYDLRYSTSPISTTSDFSSALRASDVPLPKQAETEQSTEVMGLTPDSTYYFAIQAIDDGDNKSDIGVTEGTPLPDILPPAPITDFQITGVSTSDLSVTLEWTATGDDRRQGTASSYDFRYADEPITTAADFERATEIPLPFDPAEAGERQSIALDESDGLKQDQTYHFALRAEDNTGNSTPVATPQETAVLTRDIRVMKGGPLSAARGTAETTFVVTESQSVRVALYDLLGRRIRVIFDDQVPEGFEQAVQYDVNDLSSGPYFLRFTGETFTKTRQIMVVN